MRPLIECVPNFSEGRDHNLIEKIADSIREVEGVTLLGVDPGASTNRTVVTFVGHPGPVMEAAFRSIRTASELIDMSRHQGAHPRMGATDVCPIVPISGISFDECVSLAKDLGLRVGEELGIPVYLYEKAATAQNRRNLSVLREGEYEGFAAKIARPEWKPDFGPQKFNAKSGQTAIGVRDFLIAYNVNLNTKSVRRANSVAFDVRENGRIKTVDGTPEGKKILDENGEAVRIPGLCKAVKGIGWFVAEYGIAQVSMNLTDISVTPLHAAFDACLDSAHSRGLRVTGSEIVGLLPMKCLLDAGKHFLRKQGLSEGQSEEELIQIAVKSLGLSDLKPFLPDERVIEYAINRKTEKQLVDFSVREFCNETLSDSPAPGGGSVSALCGALGVSLGGMVANLSASKRGWENRTGEFSTWAVQAQWIKDKLLFLVDEDTRAFNAFMEAVRLPNATDEERRLRTEAKEKAGKNAAEVPLQVMEIAFSAYELLEAMAIQGNPASVTDAGVGAMCIHTSIAGAEMNVRINLGGIADQVFNEKMKQQADQLSKQSQKRLEEILAVVRGKIGR